MLENKSESAACIGKYGPKHALCEPGQINHGMCPKWWGCRDELAPKQGISFEALLQTLHRPCGKQKVRHQDRDMIEHRIRHDINRIGLPQRDCVLRRRVAGEDK
jgi:hypothetical protein